MTDPLRDSQAAALLWALEHPRSGLFLPMGFGKTRVVLEGLSFHEWPRTLVVAPKRVAEDVWPEQIEMWTPGVTYSLAAGSAKERVAALAADAAIYIIGRDNLAWLVNQGLKEVRTMLGVRRNKPFEAIIIDELSSFKSHRSARFRALRSLTLNPKTPPHTVWGLTGTPASDNLMDLWAEVYVLDGGDALGKGLTNFRDRFFEPDNPHKPFPKMIPKAGAEQAIYQKLAGTCLSMGTDIMTGLIPEVTYNRINVTLPRKLRDEYDTFMQHAVWGILGFETITQADGTHLRRPILADNAIPTSGAASLRSKALQYTSGFLYDGAREVQRIHTAKLDAAEEIVESLDGDPLLVFYRFTAERDALKARLRDKAHFMKGPDVVKDWNKGKIPVLLAHPQSAGHGLNLQHGGCQMLWLSMPDSQQDWSQSVRRLLRPGQQRPVTVSRLAVTGTWDDPAYDNVMGKLRVEQALLTHLSALRWTD